MLGLDRKKVVAGLLGCAASVLAPAALAQVVDCTELEADPDTYGQVIYGSGGSAVTATLARVAGYLASRPVNQRITVVYYDPGACSGYEQYLNNELYAIPNNTATIKYWVPNTSNPLLATERTCTLAEPHKLDFSHMGNPHEFCAFSNEQLPAGYPDDPTTGSVFAASPGPIQTLNIIVDKDSSQTSISAEALYYLYGFGAGPTNIGGSPFPGISPWTNPAHVVVRPSTAFVHQILADAIFGEPGRPFYDDPGVNGQPGSSGGNGRLGYRASTNGLVVSQVALLGNSNAESSIGYVSGSAAETEAARRSIKTLAYQHYDQTQGYLPDSNDSIADKANVRNGKYHLWSPGHFYTRAVEGAALDGRGELVDFDDIRDGNGEPNEALTRFVRWFAGAENEDVLRRVILAGDIPLCASTVTREGLLGAISSVAPPDPCTGFFLSVATGSTDGACSSDDECTDEAPKCRHHFCEAY